ncbi:MAG: acetate--CoA ligase family protein, partial [Bacteroidota bacterium]
MDDNRLSDPSYDVLRTRPHPLDAVFSPGAVAVVGATEQEGSVGRTLLENLISGSYEVQVYPVNPRRDTILGRQTYRSVVDVPASVDLAIIATPAATVPTVIRECIAAEIPTAIIISAGFREIGTKGQALEEEVRATAEGRMRIIGPNCLGVMRPHAGFNATFAGQMARPGSVAFLSQSGALLTSILDWSLSEHVGFSAFVSIGSMLDVGWGDLITYFGDDARTRSIVLYMESIGDARAFLSAARAVSLHKPIIVMKAGRTEQAARAAVSHTGTLAGSDAVLNAAFRRTGVLRVDAIADLFYLSEVLSKQPRPRGSRLAIVTNAGGPGVLATDALIESGGQLADLSPESIAQLDEFLPSSWSRANPVDVLGDADPERYVQAIEVCRDDDASDGLLTILTPQAMTEPTATADRLRSLPLNRRKPLLTCWMGGESVAAGRRLLNEADIPTFAYPDTAARVFNYMWRYSYNLRGLYETPVLAEEGSTGSRGEIEAMISKVRRFERTLLTEYESKQVLAGYGIPTVETVLAASVEEALQAAQGIGFPVAMKLNSSTLTHKSDVGGVVLDIREKDDLRKAFHAIEERAVKAGGQSAFDGVTVQKMVREEGVELIVGSTLDRQFGPVLLFGAGGTLVELYRDRALALPPLTTTLARRMMEQTKIYGALQGWRGRKSVDLSALEQLLVRFGHLVVEQRQIAEIDINPLLATENGFIALDARITLHPESVSVHQLPELAIRPYPKQYAREWTTAKGRRVMIRPIRPEDEPLMVDFHAGLSEESVYMRYAGAFKLSQRVAHERLARIWFIDYDREM